MILYSDMKFWMLGYMDTCNNTAESSYIFRDLAPYILSCSIAMANIFAKIHTQLHINSRRHGQGIWNCTPSVRPSISQSVCQSQFPCHRDNLKKDEQNFTKSLLKILNKSNSDKFKLEHELINGKTSEDSLPPLITKSCTFYQQFLIPRHLFPEIPIPTMGQNLYFD